MKQKGNPASMKKKSLMKMKKKIYSLSWKLDSPIFFSVTQFIPSYLLLEKLPYDLFLPNNNYYPSANEAGELVKEEKLLTMLKIKSVMILVPKCNVVWHCDEWRIFLS